MWGRLGVDVDDKRSFKTLSEAELLTTSFTTLEAVQCHAILVTAEISSV
jgi:hypothetical protein